MAVLSNIKSGNGQSISSRATAAHIRAKAAAYKSVELNAKAKKAKAKAVESKAKVKAASRPAKQTNYNQAYWASRLAGGASQAELAAEQKSVGMKKAYSGDMIVSKDAAKTAQKKLAQVTGSMATLQNGGVTKDEKTSGLLDENKTTTYEFKRGPTITQKSTNPILPGSIGMFDLGGLAGMRLGEKTSTTYADGVEVATKTGHDPYGRDAKVTTPETAGHITDTTKVAPTPDAINSVGDVDKAIANETDPAKLAALHQRRLQLMRSFRTQTQHSPFALGAADIKRARLMGIK